MKPETITATATVNVPTFTVFDVLADPSTHAAIDGTGWVCEPVDDALLDHVGQVFRMGMYHPNHPDKNYETHNRLEVFDRPSAICWKPGYISSETGELDFGGMDVAIRLCSCRTGSHRGHVDLRLVGE